ncbi:MAG: hypothetical protein ACFFDI_12320 [Promethearchaeota archaeon]
MLSSNPTKKSLKVKIDRIYETVEIQNWTSATQLLEEIDHFRNELNSIQLQLSKNQNPLWQEELREYERQLREGINFLTLIFWAFSIQRYDRTPPNFVYRNQGQLFNALASPIKRLITNVEEELRTIATRLFLVLITLRWRPETESTLETSTSSENLKTIALKVENALICIFAQMNESFFNQVKDNTYTFIDSIYESEYENFAEYWFKPRSFRILRPDFMSRVFQFENWLSNLRKCPAELITDIFLNGDSLLDMIQYNLFLFAFFLMKYTEKDWKTYFEKLSKELRGKARIRFLSELISDQLAEESTTLKPYHVLFIDHLAQFFARTLTSEQLNDFGGLQHFIMRVKPLVLGLTEITEHVYEDFIQAFLDLNHQIALSDEEYAKKQLSELTPPQMAKTLINAIMNSFSPKDLLEPDITIQEIYKRYCLGTYQIVMAQMLQDFCLQINRLKDAFCNHEISSLRSLDSSLGQHLVLPSKQLWEKFGTQLQNDLAEITYSPEFSANKLYQSFQKHRSWLKKEFRRELETYVNFFKSLRAAGGGKKLYDVLESLLSAPNRTLSLREIADSTNYNLKQIEKITQRLAREKIIVFDEPFILPNTKISLPKTFPERANSVVTSFNIVNTTQKIQYIDRKQTITLVSSPNRSKMRFIFKTLIIGVSIYEYSELHKICKADLGLHRSSFKANYMLTIGTDFAVTRFQIKGIEKDLVTQEWYLPHMVRFEYVQRLYQRGAKGAFLVLDLSNPQGTEAIINRVRSLDSISAPQFLIGLKTSAWTLEDPTIEDIERMLPPSVQSQFQAFAEIDTVSFYARVRCLTPTGMIDRLTPVQDMYKAFLGLMVHNADVSYFEHFDIRDYLPGAIYTPGVFLSQRSDLPPIRDPKEAARIIALLLPRKE